MLACRGPCSDCGKTWLATKSRRKCDACHQRASRKANPGRTRAWEAYGRLKRRYGVSITWYLAQFYHQRGRCACCGNEQAGRALSVDHDHVTGLVRELLCDPCNLLAVDKPRVDRVHAYLERH